MQPAKYEQYRLYFLKERMIYSNLNKCYLHDNFLDGEVWIPEEKFNVKIQYNYFRLCKKVSEN